MAWGMIMTAFTLFGMLALVISSLTMESGEQQGAVAQRQSEAAGEFKQAA